VVVRGDHTSKVGPWETHPDASSVLEANRLDSVWEELRIAQAEPSPPAAESVDADGPAARQSVEEVVVTAQKREERLIDVPVPVAVIDADMLASNSQVRLRDYYTTVPGLTVSPDIEEAQSISVRGITTGGFTNPTVGVMIDEVPFGGSTLAASYLPDIDPGDLARIEVLRGPQGTLYGANSMGGLVKFVTKEPSTSGLSGRVEAGTTSVHNGAHSGFNIRGSINVPLGETFAVRLSAYERQDPGYVDNPVLNLKGINESESDGMRVAAWWRPSADFSLRLSAHYQYTEGDGIADVQPTLGDLQQNYVRGVGPYTKEIQAYDATLKARLGSIDLTSITGYNIADNINTLDFSGTFGARALAMFGVSGTPFVTHSAVNKLTQEIRLSGPLGTKFEWLGGVFYTHEDTPSSQTLLAVNPTTGALVAEARNSDFPRQLTEYAAFGDLTWHVTDRFDVQLGGRQSHIRFDNDPVVRSGPFYGPTPIVEPAVNADNRAFTYLVTPRFRISPDLMVYARFASGFRPGGPNTAGAVSEGAPANSSPDKTRNYELGIKQSLFGGAASLDASAYYIDWSDIQVQVFGRTFGYADNGGSAKSEGVEVSVQATPFQGLTLEGWVAYNNALVTGPFPARSSVYGVAGNRLPFSSRFSGYLSAEQQFHLWGEAIGFAGGALSYVGDRVGVFTQTPARQDYPSYARTDVRIGVKSELWTASAYINNVTDKRAALSGGVGYFLPQSFIYIQPRTVGLSLVRMF
jgi:outer membrane receptor protein involved in Fe transport